jgi:hypothetical protein
VGQLRRAQIFTAERAGERPATWDNGEAAYALRDAGGWAPTTPSSPDMDVTEPPDRDPGIREPGAAFLHANSHVALAERRWYVAGTEGTLIADLVRNRLMVRRALSRQKPERIDYGG